MVQVELDSIYVKFKHLLHAEKDATLTLKSEAGRSFVTLSLDLGHVHSGQGEVPRGSGNGPSSQRWREKHEAARAETVEDEMEVESEWIVDETSPVENSDTEETQELETKLTAVKATETPEDVNVPFIDDELCSDTTYRNSPMQKKDGANESDSCLRWL